MHSKELRLILHNYQKRRINLTGVNTGDKRESCAGFRETHVKCSCSSDIAKRLSDCLTAIGAMNVKIGELILVRNYKCLSCH